MRFGLDSGALVGWPHSPLHLNREQRSRITQKWRPSAKCKRRGRIQVQTVASGPDLLRWGGGGVEVEGLARTSFAFFPPGAGGWQQSCTTRATQQQWSVLNAWGSAHKRKEGTWQTNANLPHAKHVEKPPEPQSTTVGRRTESKRGQGGSAPASQ